jgi:glycosyltransferase involved in cell wall biosynthesis
MAGAMLFVNPSPNESFSIVTLEAMAQNTPILANSASSVLADHIEDSGAGRTYKDYQSFAQALQELASDKAARKRMGEMGREYVLSKYRREKIGKALINAVESLHENANR